MERGQRREHWLVPKLLMLQAVPDRGKCPIPGPECRVVFTGYPLSLSLGCRMAFAVLCRAAGGITLAPRDTQEHREVMLTTRQQLWGSVPFQRVPSSFIYPETSAFIYFSN